MEDHQPICQDPKSEKGHRLPGSWPKNYGQWDKVYIGGDMDQLPQKKKKNKNKYRRREEVPIHKLKWTMKLHIAGKKHRNSGNKCSRTRATTTAQIKCLRRKLNLAFLRPLVSKSKGQFMQNDGIHHEKCRCFDYNTLMAQNVDRK
uniref:Uncharacterized protein n=1 Tax=Ditylenchus dipsaci TaxID=166011 RepID=A0A915DBY8_9BILA